MPIFTLVTWVMGCWSLTWIFLAQFAVEMMDVTTSLNFSGKTNSTPSRHQKHYRFSRNFMTCDGSLETTFWLYFTSYIFFVKLSVSHRSFSSTDFGPNRKILGFHWIFGRFCTFLIGVADLVTMNFRPFLRTLAIFWLFDV